MERVGRGVRNEWRGSRLKSQAGHDEMGHENRGKAEVVANEIHSETNLLTPSRMAQLRQFISTPR